MTESYRVEMAKAQYSLWYCDYDYCVSGEASSAADVEMMLGDGKSVNFLIS